MRGKDERIKDKTSAAGITPAYAGKSLPQPKFVGVIKDHPRLCGEKPFFNNPQSWV